MPPLGARAYSENERETVLTLVDDKAAVSGLCLSIVKMSGAGNDFVMFDNRGELVSEPKKKDLVNAMCPRRTSIGADGVILVEQATEPDHDYRMRIFNADGGEAEMCGNGARCIAVYANRIGAAGSTQRIQTMAGTVEATVGVDGKSAQVKLSQPGPMDAYAGLSLLGESVDMYAINTGVPHAVCFVGAVNDMDVKRVGAAIRHHEVFLPKGTNANLVEVLAPDVIWIRTYERGVEDETLACGTGAAACAIVSAMIHGCTSPLKVHVASGDVLTIHFELNRDSGTSAPPLLEGAVHTVFEGQFNWANG